MKVKRTSSLSNLVKPVKTYTTTYLWCSDGWIYDTVNQTHHQVFIDDKFFHILKEPYTGAYPRVMHSEEVIISIFSEKPVSWSETVEGHVEYFVEVLE
jgi:hypothetical protein